MGTIRVGIGGWNFAPWRGSFYPEKLPHARELDYASHRLGAIEINATYHKLQKPESFAKWAKETPDGFVFAVKASRFCTNRKVLAEAGESIERFVAQGLTELGDKLGPILWQFMPTKAFDPQDFGAFLVLLPARHEGIGLRHAVEVRHESFVDPAFVALARKHKVAICFADKPGYPSIADQTGSYGYARLQAASEDHSAGYTPAALDRWAEVAKHWERGHDPEGLPLIEPPAAPPAAGRDLFVFFINGAKVRAPAAAQALIERLPSGATT